MLYYELHTFYLGWSYFQLARFIYWALATVRSFVISQGQISNRITCSKSQSIGLKILNRKGQISNKNRKSSPQISNLLLQIKSNFKSSKTTHFQFVHKLSKNLYGSQQHIARFLLQALNIVMLKLGHKIVLYIVKRHAAVMTSMQRGLPLQQ